MKCNLNMEALHCAMYLLHDKFTPENSRSSYISNVFFFSQLWARAVTWQLGFLCWASALWSPCSWLIFNLSSLNAPRAKKGNNHGWNTKDLKMHTQHWLASRSAVFQSENLDRIHHTLIFSIYINDETEGQYLKLVDNQCWNSSFTCFGCITLHLPIIHTLYISLICVVTQNHHV